MEGLEEKVTLRMLSDDFVVLQRNGQDLACPFIPPIPTQKNDEDASKPPIIVLTRSMCSSLCALFKVRDGGKSVFLNCGSGVEYVVDKIIPVTEQMQAKKEEVKMIKLMNTNPNTIN